MINFLSSGTLPWYTKKWWANWPHSKKNAKPVLFIAADLGHYIADAHMPYTRQSRWTTYGSKEFTLYGKVEFLSYFKELQVNCSSATYYEDVDKGYGTWLMILIV
jgi:hypothetical protein